MNLETWSNVQLTPYMKILKHIYETCKFYILSEIMKHIIYFVYSKNFYSELGPWKVKPCARFCASKNGIPLHSFYSLAMVEGARSLKIAATLY
jgi:hypothetical protein